MLYSKIAVSYMLYNPENGPPTLFCKGQSVVSFKQYSLHCMSAELGLKQNETNKTNGSAAWNLSSSLSQSE